MREVLEVVVSPSARRDLENSTNDHAAPYHRNGTQRASLLDRRLLVDEEAGLGLAHEVLCVYFPERSG